MGGEDGTAGYGRAGHFLVHDQYLHRDAGLSTADHQQGKPVSYCVLLSSPHPYLSPPSLSLCSCFFFFFVTEGMWTKCWSFFVAF